MNAIVSVTDTWAIGNNGQLIVKNPIDMQFFKTMTQNKCVIYGTNTSKQFKNGMLANRHNIIVTTRKNYSNPNISIAHSIKEAIAMARKNHDTNDIFIIGGASIYNQTINYREHI